MGKRVTLADVAARAGTSTTAVSLVLNDRPGTRLSEATSERIRQAATELGYRPNQAARSLRLGRTATFGFISDEVTVTRYASAMIRGVLDAAESASHTVLMAETGTDPARVQDAVRAMVDRRVDGLVVALMKARMIDAPATLPAELPVVLLNASTPDRRPCVLRDEASAGYQTASELLRAGHRSVVMLGWAPELMRDLRVSNQVGDRLGGIERALDEYGVTDVQRVDVTWDHPNEAREVFGRMLDEGNHATGIIALNDRIAFGAYQALKGRGRTIPGDWSIVSFDDEELASYLSPALTTARIPYEEMGRTAVEMLLTPDAFAQEVRLPMPLQVRRSVGAPRG